ncbi:protein DpdD [Nocardia sp. AB354]|uniref:protein DpdD n=1 Tax=Nocardia sp. AB354 TaxID=3413283 RepID=UPI003C26EC21
MTVGDKTATERITEAARIEGFIQAFLSNGNDAGDPRYASIVMPFLDSLRRGDDSPVILPRFSQNADTFAMYVIAESPTQATQIRELIGAFVGPTYCTRGDSVPASLDPADPIDAAVIDFGGADTTFILHTSSNRIHRANLRKALGLMQQTLARRNVRIWNGVRPLGRLIAEFDASLAAGGAGSSKTILDQIASQGRITATNLAHLRIKRLDRLGMSQELISFAGLNNVLRQDPPLPVKEAVLNAVHAALLAESLSRGDLQGAIDQLCNSGIPLPTFSDIRPLGNEAVIALLTAAVGRRDTQSIDRILSDLEVDARTDAIPDILLRGAMELSAPSETSGFETEPLPPGNGDVDGEPISDSTPLRAPESWVELFEGAVQGTQLAAAVLRDESWRSWPSPAESDIALSRILDNLDDNSWRQVWELVGTIIDAVGYGQSAPLTVREFITYALASDKLFPGDLITIHALIEILFRSSPVPSIYRAVLDELRESSTQWVSPENAVAVLDFADRLVLAACPDENARLSLAIALLEPLNRYQRRLEPAVFSFARQLSRELDVPLEWVQEEDPENGHPFESLSDVHVLLYSLDEAVLSRTSAELKRMIPDLRISLSHDRVGSAALREKSRNADVVVLATRCAKHAATGFITENAKDSEIAYADGSGSASLLRAAVAGLLSLGKLR